MGLLDLLPFVGKILDRIIPDPTQKAAAQLQLLQLQQSSDFKQLDSDLQLSLAQLRVDNTEAASSNIFKSGWRPFIGWICGIAFAGNFLVTPMLTWASSAFWHVPVPTPLDLSQMMPVLLGMLGLGAMRTSEKIGGVKS